MRKIIHIDMDAFFASIEQRDNSEYQGKPLVVGYPGDRGVVASASYEARKYGIKSAMSSKMALRKCPHLIFTPTRFDVYQQVSNQIMNIFHEYTDLVDPLSLDEAFLDVTSNHKNIPYATQIAVEIRDKIFNECSLTASAGISYNKFLAKIASDYNKPNGQFIIRPKDAEKFVENLPVELFFGVGKVTAKKMHQLGIRTGFDLKQKTELELIGSFGKMGLMYYQNARAIDNRNVESERVRKSIGAENTFEKDISSFKELEFELADISSRLFDRIEKKSFEGNTITLKIKYADFKIISRSKTIYPVVKDLNSLYRISLELLQNIVIEKDIRLLGLSIKKLNNTNHERAIQLSLNFDNEIVIN